MGEIKPIQTYYNGYYFRSRLEARWAVFFDALGVNYEYEPEGFILPSKKCYLPDFKVKCYGTRGSWDDIPFDLYIEVKGVMTEEDASKISEFVHSGDDSDEINVFQHPVLVVSNIPSRGNSHNSMALHAYEGMNGTGIIPFNYETIDGDYFAAYPAGCNGKFYLWGDDSNYIMNTKVVEDAYNTARRARFEYGETPDAKKLRHWRKECDEVFGALDKGKPF